MEIVSASQVDYYKVRCRSTHILVSQGQLKSLIFVRSSHFYAPAPQQGAGILQMLCKY